MKKWDYITTDELSSIKFHKSVPKEQSVDLHLAVEYFNSFVDGFSKYNPIMENRTIVEDFNFIRTFKNILFSKVFGGSEGPKLDPKSFKILS